MVDLHPTARSMGIMVMWLTQFAVSSVAFGTSALGGSQVMAPFRLCGGSERSFGVGHVFQCNFPRISSMRGGGADDGEADEDVERRDKALIARLQEMRSEAAALQQRRMMLEQEVEDHFLVTQALTGFDKGRRCYRSVGGVLMESTVGDVQPAVDKELDMLSKALDELTTKLSDNQKNMVEFQQKHSIRILRDNSMDP